MIQEHEESNATDPSGKGAASEVPVDQTAPREAPAPSDAPCEVKGTKRPKKKTHTVKVDEDHYKALEAQAHKAQENYDKFMRTYADLENYRKRAIRELQEVRRYGSEPLLTDLLPVLDNFERALEAAQRSAQGSAITDGIGMIVRQLKAALEKHGVEEMNPVGQPFDPGRHHAVGFVETAEHPAHIVVEVLRRGYLFHGRVLQPATVNVSVAPGHEEAAAEERPAHQEAESPTEAESNRTDTEGG